MVKEWRYDYSISVDLSFDALWYLLKLHLPIRTKSFHTQNFMIDLVSPNCFKTSCSHPISILKELQLIITLLIRVFENPSDFGIISKHIVILHFCHTEARVFAIFMPINLPQICFSP
jgi:hypothetical protein